MTTDRHPFEKIALSLSSGGARAMGFHLGTLAYLDRTGLLENVRIMSTVSGGSAIGIGYAAYRQIPKDGERPLMTLYREMHAQIAPDPAILLEGTESLRSHTVAGAATVPTQFWLAQEDLTDLLACGRATICYNLLKHMQCLLGQEPDLRNGSQFNQLYSQLEKDWQDLKANPYHLVRDPYRD